MRTHRRRTKKLAIAFRFSRQAEPGWKCADCRALGLERERNCGYLGITPAADAPPVWASGDLVLKACPKPLITGLSVALIEAHAWWAHCGKPFLPEQSARSLDAFAWLDRLRNEERAGRQEDAERQRGFHIQR
ncbi:MAG: hypothetical protein IT169_00195 [Bryobacterales bacterium]|nr:hypothetical protein [Bryobacterales bacterium]